MRINREIRAPRVRVIDEDGGLIGVMPLIEAMSCAEKNGLDLVEIAPNANPPVCRIIDYGKFCYQRNEREKENKKRQHKVKVKEIKVKPNTDENDINTKLKHAKDFLVKGDKVRLVCVFRGREMMHQELGANVLRKISHGLNGIGIVESGPKMLGKMLSVIIAPAVKKKIEKQATSVPLKDKNGELT